MTEVIYYWAKGRAWKCVEDGGFEVELVAIDQGWRILLMVTKGAAMSFSQFGYPYNATSQVSHFAVFFFYYYFYCCLYTRVHVYTRAPFSKENAFLLFFFFYAPLIVRRLFWEGECQSLALLTAFLRAVLLLWNQISIHARPCPITLNYEWTHVFLFFLFLFFFWRQ